MTKRLKRWWHRRQRNFEISRVRSSYAYQKAEALHDWDTCDYLLGEYVTHRLREKGL